MHYCPPRQVALSTRACQDRSKPSIFIQHSITMRAAASARWQAARPGHACAAARQVPKRHSRIAVAAPKVATASMEVGEGDSDSWFFTEVGQKTWCARDAVATV